MRKIVFVLLTIAALNEAKVPLPMPKGLHTCRRTDRDLNICFERNANLALSTYLPKGDSKYNIPPTEPKIWNNLFVAIKIPGFEFSLKDITAYGLNTMKVEDATVDFENKTIKYILKSPNVCWRGKYIADANITGTHQTTEGDAEIHFRNGRYYITLGYKLITIDGIEYANVTTYYAYFLKVDLNFKFDALDTNPLVHEAWQMIKEHFIGTSIEKDCGHINAIYFNYILNVVPFNEVFPP